MEEIIKEKEHFFMFLDALNLSMDSIEEATDTDIFGADENNVFDENKNNENAGHYAARKNAYDILLSLGEKKLPFNQLNKSNESVLDLIEDLSFKENLPKMIGKLIKEENKEELVENKEVVDGNQVVEVEKHKKIGGLSSIKRK